MMTEQADRAPWNFWECGGWTPLWMGAAPKIQKSKNPKQRPAAALQTSRKRSYYYFLGFLALAVAGCGGGKSDVSGQVKFKGEPLPSGRVTFICQAGAKEVFSSEIREGRYNISGIPAGPVKITVETFAPAPATTLPAKIPGGIPPNIKGMPPPGAPPPAPGKYVAIPPRYGNVKESGLSYTMTTGQQEHEITLQP